MDAKIYYFFDKKLPFGALISCSHYQRFSNAVSYLITYCTGKKNVNYLNDYLFASLLRALCNNQVHVFMNICKAINLPLNQDKTYWATTTLVFLGFLINTIRQLVLIPVDKIITAKELINSVLNKKSGKFTLHQLQKNCGFLNFLGRCIILGHAFTQRLYVYTSNTALKAHHHIRINSERRSDLKTWLIFLDHPSAFARPFFYFTRNYTSKELDFYSNASGKVGYGAICGPFGCMDYGKIPSWWKRDQVLNSLGFMPW